jgi:hypothetical protein
VETLKEPALQLEHVDAPVAAWKWPAAQGVHEDTLVLVEKVPASQFVQTVAPLYWPAGQTMAAQLLEPVAVA